MTKRKIAETSEASKTPLKARKQQAFTATRNASTNSIITRNAVESRLLELPSEIRSKIWREVLGDHLVHIVEGFPYDAYYPAVSFWSVAPLQHYVCVQEQSEVATYQQWKADIEKGSPKPVDHWKHNNDCIVDFQCDKHFSCAATESHPVEQSKKKLQLALLRTCRQIYVEANEVLWGTNTFSFGETRLLRDFVAQRNATQKQLWKKIHVKWSTGSAPWFVPLPMDTIKALSGVRVVHLTLVASFARSCAVKWTQDEWARDAYVGQILVLRILPLEVVTVTFDSKVADLPPTQRLEHAEDIRRRLLDPDGPKDFEEKLKQREEMWAALSRFAEGGTKGGTE
ncbi:hypothetical protein MMC17_005133 [Xylographa soralifera]|nr:hypothetical protein [Xylographa soralifera]